MRNESTDTSGGHGGGDEVVARELTASMCEGVVPTVGVKEGLESAITCMAIDRAMETGAVVDLTSDWRRADEVLK